MGYHNDGMFSQVFCAFCLIFTIVRPSRIHLEGLRLFLARFLNRKRDVLLLGRKVIVVLSLWRRCVEFLFGSPDDR